MSCLRRIKRFIVLLPLVLLFAGTNLLAQGMNYGFLHSGNIYLEKTEMRLVVIPTQEGVFVVILNNPTSLQDFDVQTLLSKEGTQFFLSFKDGRFDSMLVPSDANYSISGNFTLEISAAPNRAKLVRLVLSTEQPYLSISWNTQSAHSVLGILGVSPIVNDRRLEYFETDQIQKHFDGIREYRIIRGKVTLGTKAHRKKDIGVDLKVNSNTCRAADKTIYLKESDIRVIKRITDRNEQRKYLARILNSQKKRSPISELTLIKDSPLVGINAEGKPFAIDLLRGAASGKDVWDSQVCLIREL